MKGRKRPANDAIRLAYLVSHPIQYQAPLLRGLSADSRIRLRVLFLSDLSTREFRDPGFGVRLRWDVPLLQGYDYRFLRSLGRNGVLSFWRPLVRGLRGELAAGGFDALWLHDYAHQASLRAIRIARSLGIKVLLRCEPNLISHRRSAAKLLIKGHLLPRLFRQVDAFLAIGARNRRYYEHYGVGPERIFMMPYAVDNEFFQKRVAEASARREELREQLGFTPGRPVILFASKLQKRKRAIDLLEAYITLSPSSYREPDPYLLMVGDGEERRALEARAANAGWSSVRFAGFRNQTELPRFYDLCDVFVLPSEYEPWGLVVNEAMNAARPVIVSDQVGAGADLVRDGVNGFVVPAGDVAALASRLARLCSDRGLASAMGAEGRKRISSWDFDADVAGLTQALEYVAGGEASADLPHPAAASG